MVSVEVCFKNTKIIRLFITATYYQPKPVVQAVPPVAISVPPPPLPPPPALPQNPPVIQHQGAYAQTAPVPTYTSYPQTTSIATLGTTPTYVHPYPTTGVHRYTGYAGSRYYCKTVHTVFLSILFPINSPIKL